MVYNYPRDTFQVSRLEMILRNNEYQSECWIPYQKNLLLSCELIFKKHSKFWASKNFCLRIRTTYKNDLDCRPWSSASILYNCPRKQIQVLSLQMNLCKHKHFENIRYAVRNNLLPLFRTTPKKQFKFWASKRFCATKENIRNLGQTKLLSWFIIIQETHFK